MQRADHCRRCHQPLDMSRTFCPHCNLVREPGLLRGSVHVSTEASRDRALTELDRACGIIDYPRYERDYNVDGAIAV